MHIVILSRKSKDYFISNFIEFTNKNFNFAHKIQVLDPLNCQLFIDNNNSSLFHKGKLIENVDVVIPRLSSSTFEYGIKIIKYFEEAGVKVINGSKLISKCRNKFEMLQNLQKINGVEIPKSALIRRPKDLEIGVKLVGGLPVFLKLTSTENKRLGSILVNDLYYAESFLDINFMLDNFTKIGQNIIVQEFVKESSGYSIKYIVLGKRIIASYKEERSILNNMKFDDTAIQETSDVMTYDINNSLILNIVQEFQLNFGIISTLKLAQSQKIINIELFPDIEELEKTNKIDVISKLTKYIACDI